MGVAAATLCALLNLSQPDPALAAEVMEEFLHAGTMWSQLHKEVAFSDIDGVTHSMDGYDLSFQRSPDGSRHELYVIKDGGGEGFYVPMAVTERGMFAYDPVIFGPEGAQEVPLRGEAAKRIWPFAVPALNILRLSRERDAAENPASCIRYDVNLDAAEHALGPYQETLLETLRETRAQLSQIPGR